jgi:sulfate adenylyltransferase
MESIVTLPRFKQYARGASPVSSISLTLTQRQLCDLELLLNGAFSPLTGFMAKQDYDAVLDQMRLADGTLWPIPITLDVDEQTAKAIELGDTIALYDTEGLYLANLLVQDQWLVDKAREAEQLFGTTDLAHPGVAYLMHHTKPIYLGGTLTCIALPHHYDFQHLRHTPAMLKHRFQTEGWDKIVAFQTRNPMHRAHYELTHLAMAQTGARLLIHPVVGMTKPGDVEYYWRVRCYEKLLPHYPAGKAMLSLLPLAMRMAGPREALWHALIRKNYGCTHFIVGRDHAGPGKNSLGKDFYDPYAAQQLALQHEAELKISIIPFQEMAYSAKQNKYFPVDAFPKDDTPLTLSGTILRERLRAHLDIPAWFSYPEVITELQKAYPPKHKQGFTVFLTGLPSSGKSTLANALVLAIREKTERQVTLLDGDVIRTHLSKGLGFSQDDRETNITRVGFVAQEITRHGGVVLCALVAPYEKPRALVRQMVSEVGGFVEIYVATPLAVCEQRDRKGLYQKARSGLIQHFTGIDDPYEAPETPDMLIDTTHTHPADIIKQIMMHLTEAGYIQ